MKNFKKYYLFIFALILGIFVFNFAQAENLSSKLKGKILLQVEQNGEAWYVSPQDEKRYYMGRPDDAFNLMRGQGIGITNSDLYKISIGIISEGYEDTDGDGLSDYLEDTLALDKNNPDTDGDGYLDAEEIINGYSAWGEGKQFLDSSFAQAQAGKILLQVEKNGEAWYVDPKDAKRYFLGRPDDAFSVMRNLGLGITDKDLDEIGRYNANDDLDECGGGCPLYTPHAPDYCSDGIIIPGGKDECGCQLPPGCDRSQDDTDDEVNNDDEQNQEQDEEDEEILDDEEDEDDTSDVLPEDAPESYDSCVSDDDCVSVNAGCCSCTQGGSAMAINSYFFESWNEAVSEGCEVCVDVISEDPTCNSIPKCVESFCALVAE